MKTNLCSPKRVMSAVLIALVCIVTIPISANTQAPVTKTGTSQMAVSVATFSPHAESSPTDPPRPKNTAPSASDSAAGVTVPVKPAARPTMKTVLIDREIFQYTATGRRDPFVSLLTSDELRPLLSDLRLTTVAYDPSGHNSVAVLRDLETKQQYRVARGTPLGRMRVVRIDQKSVTFVIEEYGYSRQETLTMTDTSTTTTP